MVNDQWLILQHWRGGLAGLVSNKELLHNTWKEICHVVGKAN